MMLNWQALEQEIVEGIYEKPEAGTYTPTLVIGLGGSGLKTLRYLKTALRRHQLGRVQLLGIDSDDSENSKWPFLAQLAESELIILDQGTATAMLARAEAGEADARHVLEYLPDAEPPLTGLHVEVRKKIAAQKGAGQFRRAGRLMFHANVNGGANVSGRLDTIRQNMQGLGTVISAEAAGLTVAPGAKIYLVTSLTGGTGAGLLLDCVALLRTKFVGAQDMITAFCFLSGELLDRELYNPRQEGPVTRGNAVALLRELQAFDVGQMQRYKFRLDGNTLVGPLARFLDDIYLIGDRSDKGTRANSYMELTQALAYFLYCFLGTGVGATDAAGAINGQIVPTMRAERVPRVFSSLGIGVIEYPIQELTGFAVRASLAEWVKRWSKPKVGMSVVRAAVDGFLGGAPLFLRSVETFLDRLTPPEGELSRAKFLADPGLRRAFLKQPDEIFVPQGLGRVAEIDGILRGMAPAFQDSAEKWRNEAVARAEAWVLGRLTIGLEDGRRHIEALNQCLDAFDSKLAKERERRDSEIKKLKDELEKDGASIHFWDFLLDGPLRQRFLDKIDRYLNLKVREAADAYAATCLSEFQNAVRALSTRAEALQKSASAWAVDNERQMEKTRGQKDVPGFVQRAISHSNFPQWTQRQGLRVPDFALPGLDWPQVLQAAVESIKADCQTVLRKLDILGVAARDATLRQRIESLNTASVPMIHRMETATPMENMAPQKFVAGIFEPADSFVTDNFPPPPGKPVSTVVQTTNPHLVACAQSCHGFGAAHWRSFAEAEAYYRESPWYFHVVEKFQSLPLLQQLMVEESENLRLFGLGVMFELIVFRGNNYYRNMIASDLDGVCYFLVYSAGRSQEAAALAKTGLIREPLPSQNRPKAQDRLGDSLDSAIEGLSHPRSATFRQQLSELIDDFKTNQGAQATAALIGAYTSNALAQKISKAGQTRDLLEKIAKALEAYVSSLA